MSFNCHYFTIAAWRDLKDRIRPGIGINITIDKNKSRTVSLTTWDKLNPNKTEKHGANEIKIDFDDFWETMNDLVNRKEFDHIRRRY